MPDDSNHDLFIYRTGVKFLVRFHLCVALSERGFANIGNPDPLWIR